MSLIWIDWVIVAVLVISAIISIARGAIRECISLASWVVGIYLAFIWAGQYQDLLSAYVETPEIRYGLTFMGILIAVLLLGAMLGFILGKLVGIMGLSGIDRIFGIAFGVVRGLLLLVLAVAVARFTTWPQQDWWQESVAIPKTEELSDRLIDWVMASSWLPAEEKKILQDRLAEQDKAKKEKQKNKDWFSGERSKEDTGEDKSKESAVDAEPAPP